MARAERGSLMSGKNYSKKICQLQTEFAENNVCLICEDPAPRYVCTTFRSFVCQSCADVHREYGHQITSILHSEWDAEAYDDMAKGGNREAAAQWLAFWKPEDFARPARCDTERVKDFVRKAFVIKCWQRQPKRSARLSIVEGPAQKVDNSQKDTFANFEANWANFAPPPPAPAPLAPAVPPAEAPATTPPAPAPVVAAAAASSSSAPSTAAPPPPQAAQPEPAPQAYVPLSVTDAVYCGEHDTSEKRVKGEPRLRACQSCGLQLRTNYSGLAFCPRCSAERRQCLVCGITVPPPAPAASESAAALAAAELAAREAKCISREGSDAHSTEAPPTSAAENEENRFKADFSSDGEGLVEPTPSAVTELPGTHAAAGEGLPQKRSTGSLMDIDADVGKLEAPSTPRAPPEPLAGSPSPLPPPTPGEDWLGDVITPPRAAQLSKVADSVPALPEASVAKVSEVFVFETSKAEPAAGTVPLTSTSAVASEDPFAELVASPQKARIASFTEVAQDPFASLTGAASSSAKVEEPLAEHSGGSSSSTSGVHCPSARALGLAPAPRPTVAPACSTKASLGVQEMLSGSLSGNADAVESMLRPQATSTFLDEVPAEPGQDRFAAFDVLVGETSKAPSASLAAPPVPAPAPVTVAQRELPAAPAVVPQAPIAARGSAPASSSFMPDEWMQESEPAKPSAFDDVMTAFHEKASAWDAKARSSVPKAAGPAPGRPQQQPRPAGAEFDDLLSAWQTLGTKS